MTPIDVSNLKSLGSQGTEYAYQAPNERMLESFTSPFERSRHARVDIEFPEFTSVCPKTGQPDFANIVIAYCPRDLCVESKSLKLYLFAFRQQGQFMEAIVQKIMTDLVEAIDPMWLTVEGKFNPRGGTRLEPMCRYFHDEWVD